jgi:hypothetical protein
VYQFNTAQLWGPHSPIDCCGYSEIPDNISHVIHIQWEPLRPNHSVHRGTLCNMNSVQPECLSYLIFRSLDTQRAGEERSRL